MFYSKNRLISLLLLALVCPGQAQQPFDKLPKKSADRLQVLLDQTSSDTTNKALTYYKEALSLAAGQGQEDVRVLIISALGDHYSNSQKSDSAEYYYTSALLLAKQYQLGHEQINCLHKLAVSCEERSDFARAENFYREALEISYANKRNADIALALQEIGIFQQSRGNYTEALNYFVKELDIDKALGDQKSTAMCLNNIGLVHYKRGNFSQSIDFYSKGMLINEALGDSNSVAGAKVNIGIAYKEQGNYNKALELLVSAARYYDKINRPIEQSSCYNAIGNTQLEIGNTDYALSYHENALQIREKAGYKRGIAGSLTNIGQTLIIKKEYKKALEFLYRSLEIKNELQDNTLIASSLDLIGEAHFLKKDFATAESYYLKSVALKNATGDKKGKSITLNKMGELYCSWGRLGLALSSLDSARAIARQIGAQQELLKNYEFTIATFKKSGKPDSVIAYFEKYSAQKDTFLSDQKNKALAELQIKYETEKKEEEINLLSEKDKTQQALLGRQHILIYALTGGALLFILIIFLLIKAYRLRKRAHLQSAAVADQKQAMLQELHHRIKNNLQVLTSMLQLQSGSITDINTKEVLRAIELRLDAMLLVHRKLYGKNADSKTDMAEYIMALLKNLISSYGHDETSIVINSEIGAMRLDADKALSIGFICNEVVSNSMKHAFSQTAEREISIRLLEEHGRLKLYIADNGSGIPKEAVRSKASFGTQLIELFTDELKGSMHISSGPGGTTYTFTFPNFSKTN